MESSENTQARSRIQLRFELGSSIAQHQQHRQCDPVPPGIYRYKLVKVSVSATLTNLPSRPHRVIPHRP
jgi:hypothetical protein